MKLAILLSLLLALNTFLSAIGLKATHKIHRPVQKVSPLADSVIINSQNPGPTPFIAQINFTVSPANSLKSVQFTIAPKAGSVTRAISATYSSNYLQARGYLNTGTGSATVPVFGLYYNYTNSVSLTFFFTDNTSQQETVMVATADWTDSCGVFKNPTFLQARTTNRDL